MVGISLSEIEIIIVGLGSNEMIQGNCSSIRRYLVEIHLSLFNPPNLRRTLVHAWGD